VINDWLILFWVVVPDPTINQFKFVVSNWIGWPRSPGFLSVTLLSILRIPPTVLVILTGNGVPTVASLKVAASLIVFAVRLPSNVFVITKYNPSFTSSSGTYPSSDSTLTLSPLKKLWFDVKVKIFELITLELLFLETVNIFLAEGHLQHQELALELEL